MRRAYAQGHRFYSHADGSLAAVSPFWREERALSGLRKVCRSRLVLIEPWLDKGWRLALRGDT